MTPGSELRTTGSELSSMIEEIKVRREKFIYANTVVHPGCKIQSNTENLKSGNVPI
jgi:hypothetical protein